MGREMAQMDEKMKHTTAPTTFMGELDERKDPENEKRIAIAQMENGKTGGTLDPHFPDQVLRPNNSHLSHPSRTHRRDILQLQGRRQ